MPDPSSPPPTLQQIADHLGVSKTAMSLALRDQPRISAGLKKRVRQAASALGYTPNALVAAHMAHLRRRRAPRYQATLALVLSWSRAQIRQSVAGELYRLYRRGVFERAAQLGYVVEEFSLAAGGLDSPGDAGVLEAGRLAVVLKSRGIHGVVAAPVPVPGGRLDFAWADFAAVALGYSIGAPDLHRACQDAFSGMGCALAEVAARGYRRPGLVLAKEDDARVNHLALARFLAWQRTEGAAEPVPELLLEEQRADLVVRWFRRHRPDAVISSSAQVCAWLREAGVRVPRDAGFASTFWLPVLKGLSGVYENYDLIGASAVDMLVGQLHRNERGVPAEPKHTLLPVRWMDGGTLRARPGRRGAAGEPPA
ncbi:MAG: LacI family transcriptional regulator [Opitutaceae bacterium]|jgi:DNA-binding LacI/PurR family transcriptional regulator|nr:LacI family transcriptional regulator [Opitutaceae bacterium]